MGTLSPIYAGRLVYEFETMEQEDEEITGGYAYLTNGAMPEWPRTGVAGQFINFDQKKTWWRLADIYLLRAECRARLNDRAGAIADLNKIRNRAKAKRYNESEYDGNLRYAIFKEREKELLMEGTRYFDVLRNGYYKTELYGNFRNVSDQDVVDGVFFNALESTLYWDNPLMRQNTIG
ncbi:MAG: RagB/SusD family nutrient uptake outer membrane protein [Butyricimonas paravirosa]